MRNKSCKNFQQPKVAEKREMNTGNFHFLKNCNTKTWIRQFSERKKVILKLVSNNYEKKIYLQWFFFYSTYLFKLNIIICIMCISSFGMKFLDTYDWNCNQKTYLPNVKILKNIILMGQILFSIWQTISPCCVPVPC